MLGDFRIDQVCSERLEAIEGAFLVQADEPAVADHVGREDCGEAAFPPIWRSTLHGVLPSPAILYAWTRWCARRTNVRFPPLMGAIRIGIKQ
jgi:hypothetical protein